MGQNVKNFFFFERGICPFSPKISSQTLTYIYHAFSPHHIPYHTSIMAIKQPGIHLSCIASITSKAETCVYQIKVET